MGKVVNASKDPVQALYDELDNVWTWIRNMAGNHPTLLVTNSGATPLTLQDNDGSVWLNADDNTLHYVVNGTEYALTGTPV